MPKEHMRLGETVRKIAEAERHLKAGNLAKAAETTPCEDCRDKIRTMKKTIEAEE